MKKASTRELRRVNREYAAKATAKVIAYRNDVLNLAATTCTMLYTAGTAVANAGSQIYEIGCSIYNWMVDR